MRTIWGHLNAVVGRGAEMTWSPAGSPLLAGRSLREELSSSAPPTECLSPLPAPASAHGQVARACGLLAQGLFPGAWLVTFLYPVSIWLLGTVAFLLSTLTALWARGPGLRAQDCGICIFKALGRF